MSDDPQDTAEQFDEDVVGSDPVTSDEVAVDFPPDRYQGIPFADSDVTDESLAERLQQEEPEVWEGATHEEPVGLVEGPGADERLEQIVRIRET